jgi:hypothetical protein
MRRRRSELQATGTISAWPRFTLNRYPRVDGNRPADISASAAYDFLNDAANEYSIRYQQGYITPTGMMKNCDPDLYSALEGWIERPELPMPEHPPLPDNSAAASASDGPT